MFLACHIALFKVTLILLQTYIIIFYVGIIYIDLTVAFCSSKSHILLSKFPSVWLSLTTVEWFSGYIREQTPVILFNGVESGVKMLYTKLPQS